MQYLSGTGQGGNLKMVDKVTANTGDTIQEHVYEMRWKENNDFELWINKMRVSVISLLPAVQNPSLVVYVGTSQKPDFRIANPLIPENGEFSIHTVEITTPEQICSVADPFHNLESTISDIFVGHRNQSSSSGDS